MALGLRGRIAEARDALDPSARYQDLAIQLRVKPTGELVGAPIGEPGAEWQVWGGVWDHWTGRYTGERPTDVLVIDVSRRQADYILDLSERVSGKGGRGGGKSVAEVVKALCRALIRPGLPGQLVSPTFDLAMVLWTKMLAYIPLTWLLPGTRGISRSDKTIRLVNGVTIRFRSGDRPDGLRSWDGNWTGADEEKDLTDETLDIIWGSLRLGPRPQLFGAGTPEMGAYQDRWEKLRQQAESGDMIVGLHSFPSRENPFLDARVWDVMMSQMDERRYRQEILAEFVERDDIPLVFPEYKPDVHGVKWPIPDAEDITAEIVRRRLNLSLPFIVGVDPNYDAPNYAVIFKVFMVPTGRAGGRRLVTNQGPVIARQDAQRREIWVAWDIVQAKGHCGVLAKRLKESGYGASAIIIDAASGKGPRGKMRVEGMRVFHPKRNPWQTDSVTDVLTKLAPIEGEPSLYLRLPQCEELSDSLQAVFWDRTGKKIDKGQEIDHVVDAMRYPISYFCPAGKIKSTTHGYVMQ